MNGFEPTKKETRAVLIKELLGTNPPRSQWISDYFGYVVSVGKLYVNYDDNPNVPFATPHMWTAPGGGAIGVNSKVLFDGYVNKEELLNLITGQRTPTYQPASDLNALNVVSWLRVRSKEFSGGLMGKKFYPEKAGLSRLFGYSTRKGVNPKDERIPYGGPLYELKTGFFTSVRLGTEALLLNVNTTTSAFYAQVTVHDWVITRCSGDNDRSERCIPHDEAIGELEGLKVTMIGDADSKRQYRIVEVQKATVANSVFEKEDVGEVSVYEDLLSSKFLSRVQL